METCLKRREHDHYSDVEETEDSDLEYDCETSLLAGDKNQGHNHEHDCGLISPYKRLRVEDLTQSSADFQAGEGEAHSLLKSCDDDFSTNSLSTHHFGASDHSLTHRKSFGGDSQSHQNFRESPKKSLFSSPQKSQHKNPKSSATVKNNQVKHTVAMEPQGNGEEHSPQAHKGVAAFGGMKYHVSQYHRANDATASNLHSNRDGSIPYIDEICADEDPFMSADEREFPSPPAFDQNTRLPQPVRSKAYDSLLLASYHPDFQTLESREISFHSSVDKLGSDQQSKFSPRSSSSNLYRSELALNKHKATHQGATKGASSIDILEAHIFEIDQRLNNDPNTMLTSNNSGNEHKTDKTENHYQTIEEMNSSETHKTNTSSSGGFPIPPDRDDPDPEWTKFHSPQNKPVSPNHGPWSANLSRKNQIGNSNDSHSRSVGTSCGNLTSEVLVTQPSEMCESGITTSTHHFVQHSDDVSNVYDTLDSSDTETEQTRAQHRVKKKKGSPEKKTTTTMSSGTSTNELSELHSVLSGNRVQKSRYSSQHKLSASSHVLSSGEPLLHGTKSSSLDDFHPYQSQPLLQRQHSSGSSIKSHHSSAQPHQLTHPEVPSTEDNVYAMYLHSKDSKDFESSSRSKSQLRQNSAGDLQYYVSGSQHHVSRSSSQHSSQHHSTGSLHYNSRSSQGSVENIEKSYPSSLTISGHRGKKAVLQSSGHLKISAYWNVGLLTVHIIQARCLSSSWKSHCDSYVKMSLVPDESRRTRCKTQVQLNSNSPVYDEKFSMEILEEDRRKRLLISVWHKDQGNG